MNSAQQHGAGTLLQVKADGADNSGIAIKCNRTVEYTTPLPA